MGGTKDNKEGGIDNHMTGCTLRLQYECLNKLLHKRFTVVMLF